MQFFLFILLCLSGRTLIVVPTLGSHADNNALLTAATTFANDLFVQVKFNGTIVLDVDVTPTLAATHSLIVLGGPSLNSVAQVLCVLSVLARMHVCILFRSRALWRPVVGQSPYRRASYHGYQLLSVFLAFPPLGTDDPRCVVHGVDAVQRNFLPEHRGLQRQLHCGRGAVRRAR